MPLEHKIGYMYAYSLPLVSTATNCTGNWTGHRTLYVGTWTRLGLFLWPFVNQTETHTRIPSSKNWWDMVHYDNATAEHANKNIFYYIR